MTSQTTFDKKTLIRVRDVLPGDYNFIMATFLRGLYYGNEFFNSIPKEVFMSEYHAILERRIKGPVTIKVACLKDDDDVILGYSIYRDVSVLGDSVKVLDWIFVKSAWRNIGIGKNLVPFRVQ